MLAIDRFVSDSRPVVTSDNRVVATSWPDFVDPNLALPIDRDEHGSLVAAPPPYVWTGTDGKEPSTRPIAEGGR